MLLNAFLAKLLIVLLGFLWPGYQCYKALSTSGSNQAPLLKFWCTFWLVMAAFLATEWVADVTVAWLPLYHEAKVLFVLYLWHPRTRGASAVYDRVLQPLLHQHEERIDSSLAQAQARVADSVTGHVRRAKELAMSNASSIMDSIRSFSEDPRHQQQAPLPGQQQQRKGIPASSAGKRAHRD